MTIAGPSRAELFCRCKRQIGKVALYFGKERIFIGTTGWVYKKWANDFYHGLKPKEHFPFCATQFPTVEINVTFYHAPNNAKSADENVRRFDCATLREQIGIAVGCLTISRA